MEESTFTQRIANGYSAFRGSPAFLVIITLWFVVSTLTHHFLHWDKGYADTVYYLSWEATYNGAFSLMVLERIGKMREEDEKKREQEQREHAKMLKYVTHSIQAVLSILSSLQLSGLLPSNEG